MLFHIKKSIFPLHTIRNDQRFGTNTSNVCARPFQIWQKSPQNSPIKTKKLLSGIFGGIFLKNSFSYDLDFTFMISSYGIDWEKSVLQNMSVNYWSPGGLNYCKQWKNYKKTKFVRFSAFLIFLLVAHRENVMASNQSIPGVVTRKMLFGQFLIQLTWNLGSSKWLRIQNGGNWSFSATRKGTFLYIEDLGVFYTKSHVCYVSSL